MTNEKLRYWVIPPKANAEFVAAMERTLWTYGLPVDPRHPVICMDEQPVQLTGEVRTPIPATAKHGKRVDYEYERRGTASVFVFTEALAGWREVTARPQRTKLDWRQEVARLLEGRYADAERVTLVCDNLNTHTKGAFYEAFDRERAFALSQRVEFCFTPKHGSWLNIAENELSSMTRQCLRGRRIGSLEELQEQLAAWTTDANDQQRGVRWQMTIQDARDKLGSLYPEILT